MKKKLMNYDERLDLDIEFGDFAVCGYLRRYHRYEDKLIGTCSLVGKRCNRRMPQDTDTCPTYVYWLNHLENKNEE